VAPLSAPAAHPMALELVLAEPPLQSLPLPDPPPPACSTGCPPLPELLPAPAPPPVESFPVQAWAPSQEQLTKVAAIIVRTELLADMLRGSARCAPTRGRKNPRRSLCSLSSIRTRGRQTVSRLRTGASLEVHPGRRPRRGEVVSRSSARAQSSASLTACLPLPAPTATTALAKAAKTCGSSAMIAVSCELFSAIPRKNHCLALLFFCTSTTSA
jgi:hypothetical protein